MGAHTSPGKLRMKCMIWEPQPTALRKQQDDTFVYNPDTLSLLKNLPENFHMFRGDPSGICLKPLIVYRDTFLRIGNEMLTSDRENMVDFKGQPLFKDGGVPTAPWIYHQTFRLEGSLFSSVSVAPSSSDQKTDDGFNTGISSWAYRWIDIPFATNGKNGADKSIVSNGGEDDFELAKLPGTGATADEAVNSSTDAAQKAYETSQVRKTKRLQPTQVGVSSEAQQLNNDSSGASKAAAKPIHWLVKKETDMFNLEDFFVEFVRQSYQPDIVATNSPMLDTYYYLDPLTPPATPINGRPVPWNGAVVSIGPDGAPLTDEKHVLSLANQPYYAIEIGHGDPDQNYWIILAYNHYPIFVHVGRVPILLPSKLAETPEDSLPPFLTLPDEPFSRRLSTFNKSCKELMDEEKLRITVRHHMGALAVYFNDDLDNPWVIYRNDYDLDKYATQGNAVLNDISQHPVYMRVAEAPIQIACGNMLSGFSFGPLSYAPLATMPLPNGLCVRGPIEQSDINLLLREKPRNQDKYPRYFQESDVFIETIAGQPIRTTADRTFDPSSNDFVRLRGWSNDPKKRRKYLVSNVTETKSQDGYLSYIRVHQTSQLSTLASPDDSSSTGTVQTDKIKYFSAEYTLRAGDVIVGKGDKTKAWCIANCVTPIANGWRLYVAPSDSTLQVCPVDVAHHVLNFSSQWSFGDQIKVDHSGNIKFLLNFGPMPGLASEAKDDSTAGCGLLKIDPYAIDRSAFLAKLENKAFFIRVYAWWEGGFMDCKVAGCPCKRNGLVGDAALQGAGASSSLGADSRVIFTGICYGGAVTVEAGKRVMECQLVDYWKILEDSQFLNSPFFDGMRDFNAVYEILKIAGLQDQPSGGHLSGRTSDPWPPASYMRQLASSQSSVVQGQFCGEYFWAPDYGLPSSYDILQSPLLKFPDGSKLDEAIVKIAAFAGKMVYFDRYGIFRMSGRPDQYFCKPNNRAFYPKCNFFASQADYPSRGCAELDVVATGSYTHKRAVCDVPNEIHILSTTPDGVALIGSGVNLESKFNPDAEGFLGYTKRFLQIDGVFGSQEAVEKVVKYYSGFYRPPVMVSWESYGIGKLMAGDTVTFTGLRLDDAFPPLTRDPIDNIPKGQSGQAPSTVVYLTSMSTEIDPQNNDWKNRYEGEWIFVGELECE